MPKITKNGEGSVEPYTRLMDKHGISETKQLNTAWDTFSKEYPGECSKVTINKKDIYDVVELLREKGMYRAKIIDD